MAKIKGQSANLTIIDEPITPLSGGIIQAPAGARAPAVLSEAAAAFLAGVEGKREMPAKLPLVQISHAENKFVLHTGEIVDEISGYPIYYFQTRRFYKKPPASGQKGQPPDCWSADLIAPSNESLKKESPLCATCPMNAWGTGRDGKSKACGTFTWVFLLNSAFGNPPLAVVVAPPSSIRPLLGTKFAGGYFAKANARYGAYEIVWTTLRLSAQGGESVKYSVLDPVMGHAVQGAAEAKQVLAVRNEFRRLFEEMRGLTPDLVENEVA
jgi:hypothetical protein